LAIVHSRALVGSNAPAVTVEVHLANGLPNFQIVGLPDAEVRESRERVRAALLQSGFQFPTRRITVNLAPADLPKRTSRLDLPIALGILVASDQLPADQLDRLECVGELSLSGTLRASGRGVLGIALANRRDPAGRALLLPLQDAIEARLVQTVLKASVHAPIWGLASLAEAGQVLRGEVPAGATRAQANLAEPVALENSGGEADLTQPSDPSDLSDVRGQPAAKRALEIAACGGHAILLSGPPGTGKSMLAHRLAGLLPVMTDEEALEAATLSSLTGAFDPRRFGCRPFRSPHHSTTISALIGGGHPPRPGEISLAHQGLLFLDELLEWRPKTLDALREPLETGLIQLARADRQAQFPARFQLVAATNPCPCGFLGTPQCLCTRERVQRYRARLSAPLLDRIDLLVHLTAQPSFALLGPRDGETSTTIRLRVTQARQRQLQRQGAPNAWLSAQALDQHCATTGAAHTLLAQSAQRLELSGRGLHRVLRVARSIADLESHERISIEHVAEAIALRMPTTAPTRDQGGGSGGRSRGL
jgi:magnesium chelatase family protein